MMNILSMNIDKSQEREWTKESLAACNNQILDQHTNDAELWWAHSRMADLAKKLKTTEAIEIVYSATLTLIDRLQPKSSLIVAETIIGRQYLKYRSGMIFLAYDLGLKEITRDFSIVTMKLIDRAMQQQYDTTRCNKALMNCNSIVEQLKL